MILIMSFIIIFNNVVMKIYRDGIIITNIVIIILYWVSLCGTCGQDLVWEPLTSLAIHQPTHCGTYAINVTSIDSSGYNYIFLCQNVWKYNLKCIVHRSTWAWDTFVVMSSGTMLQHNNNNSDNVVIEIVLLAPTLFLLLLLLLCQVLLSGKRAQDLLWKPLTSPSFSKHTYCGKYTTNFIFTNSSWYQYISCAKMSGRQISHVACIR